MFQFPGLSPPGLCVRPGGGRAWPLPGSPIRESGDRRPFAPPPSLSQLAAPFFDFPRQGIRRAPFPSPPAVLPRKTGARKHSFSFRFRLKVVGPPSKKRWKDRIFQILSFLVGAGGSRPPRAYRAVRTPLSEGCLDQLLFLSSALCNCQGAQGGALGAGDWSRREGPPRHGFGLVFSWVSP